MKRSAKSYTWEEQCHEPVYAGGHRLESSFAEKDQGVLVGTKLNMSQQSTLVAKMIKNILACSRRRGASSVQKLSGHVPGHLLYVALLEWGSWAR